MLKPQTFGLNRRHSLVDDFGLCGQSHWREFLRFEETFTRKLLHLAIAEWIRLRLPSCCPRFKSQAHHPCFHQFILICVMWKRRKNEK